MSVTKKTVITTYWFFLSLFYVLQWLRMYFVYNLHLFITWWPSKWVRLRAYCFQTNSITQRAVAASLSLPFTVLLHHILPSVTFKRYPFKYTILEYPPTESVFYFSKEKHCVIFFCIFSFSRPRYKPDNFEWPTKRCEEIWQTKSVRRHSYILRCQHSDSDSATLISEKSTFKVWESNLVFHEVNFQMVRRKSELWIVQNQHFGGCDISVSETNIDRFEITSSVRSVEEPGEDWTANYVKTSQGKRAQFGKRA